MFPVNATCDLPVEDSPFVQSMCLLVQSLLKIAGAVADRTRAEIERSPADWGKILQTEFLPQAIASQPVRAEHRTPRANMKPDPGKRPVLRVA